MATVIEPILTDATGQEIVDKLDELVGAVRPTASDIPLTPPSGMTATNVQDGFSEIKQSLSANYVFGNQVNIISYSSSSNMFKAPTDGYILVQTWNNDSPINLWIGANSLSIPITNTTLKAFALFAKKGTSYWIGRTGTNNSAMFLPLVIEQ